MGTFKFYVYLCIFPTTICQVKDESGGSGWFEEDINHDDGTGKQPPISDGSESKSSQDFTTEHRPQMAGAIGNTFKKPFINLNQERTGWPEEKLISKLMGNTFAETEEGNSYQPSVRSFGLTSKVFTD